MESVKIPWWFWAIAVFALLFNLIGLVDYYMSQTLNEAYLSSVDGMMDYVKAFPVWADAAWGTAVTGSVLGALALLLRKKWAFIIFVVAFVAMIIAFMYQFSAPNKPDMGVGATIFTGFIWAFEAFLIWFAKLANSKGWSR